MALTRTIIFSLLLFLAAAFCGTASLLYLVSTLRKGMEIQEQSLRGDVVWWAGGVEREARVLQNALMNILLGQESENALELRRRFDLLASSVEKMEGHEFARMTAAIGGDPKTLAGCGEMLHMAAELLRDMRPGERERGMQAAAYLASAVDGFAAFTRQAREYDLQVRQEANRNLRRVGWVTVLSAVIIFTAGTTILVVFLRNHSRLDDLTHRLEEKVEERTRLLRESGQSLKMMSQAIEQSPVSVVICNARGEIEYVNPKFVEVTGYTFAETVGRNPRFLQSGKTSRRTYEQMWQTVRSGGIWQGEICNRRKGGELFWEQVSLSPIRFAEGRLVGYLAVKEDISERKMQEEQLIRQANYDSLTGLPNRLLAMDRLQQAMLQAQRRGHRVALLFIDLDNFKQINDLLGHESGDLVLQEAAERFLACLRDCDTAARFGGDEFIIILSELHGRGDVLPILDRILKAFTVAFEVGAERFHVTASIGVSFYPDDGECAVNLLKMSDTAMYLAKNGGKNRYCFHQDEHGD